MKMSTTDQAKSGRDKESFVTRVTIAVGVLIVFATTMLRLRSSSIEKILGRYDAAVARTPRNGGRKCASH